MRPINLFILVLLLGAGCAPSLVITRDTQQSAGRFTFTPPNRWMMLQNGNTTVLSKHGPELEAIRISSRAIKDFRDTTRFQVKKGMNAYELGEVIISNIISSQQTSKVRVMEVSPAALGPIPGVMVIACYNYEGIDKKMVVYAALDDGYLYEISYTAALRYYFNEALEIFEKVHASFSLKNQ